MPGFDPNYVSPEEEAAIAANAITDASEGDKSAAALSKFRQEKDDAAIARTKLDDLLELPAIKTKYRYNILKVKNSFFVEGIFNLKCLLIDSVIPNLSQIYFGIPEIFKTNVTNRFWVQNHLFILCSRVVNSQRLFYSQKVGLKCPY